MSHTLHTDDAVVDTYVLAGDREMILIVEQRRHLMTGGKLGTRAYLTAEQARKIAGYLLEQADAMDRESTKAAATA